MPRRKMHRIVEGEPPVAVFKPAGVPARDLEEILLEVDEFEAVRLADHEGLDQRKACEAMNVSQPTFNRILNSARKKIATAIVKGCVLRIEGGNYILNDGSGGLECTACGHFIGPNSDRVTACPLCGSPNLKWARRPQRRGPDSVLVTTTEFKSVQNEYIFRIWIQLALTMSSPTDPVKSIRGER